jgi:hypothetical protein
VELQKNQMPNLHKEACWALPDKGSAAGLGDPQYFAEAAGSVDFPRFAEVAELVDPPTLQRRLSMHLYLVDY